jgi:acyl carrier protein
VTLTKVTVRTQTGAMTEQFEPARPASAPTSSPAMVEAIAVIWSEALGVPLTDLDAETSDFFELGGYSLLAMQVVSHILERFQADLPEDTFELESALLFAVFDTPTIGALAECLETNVPVQVTGAQP